MNFRGINDRLNETFRDLQVFIKTFHNFSESCFGKETRTSQGRRQYFYHIPRFYFNIQEFTIKKHIVHLIIIPVETCDAGFTTRAGDSQDRRSIHGYYHSSVSLSQLR
jgi:hypothetical protein